MHRSCHVCLVESATYTYQCYRPLFTFPSSSTACTMASDTIATPETHLSCKHETEENIVPEIPSHWLFKRDNHPLNHTYFCWRPFMHFLHHLFCAIGFGHASLHTVWEKAHPDTPDKIWEAGRDLLRERLEHINIVVRLCQSLDRCLIDFNYDIWPRLL